MGSDPAKTATERELVVERTFDALPEAVFDAWLDPKGLGKWLFATPGGEMVKVEVDARVGGSFKIVERRGDELAEHFGEYLELNRPQRIVLALATEKGHRPSRVTVDIEPTSRGSRMTLTNRIGMEWAEYFDRTRDGWSTILNGLAATLEELTLVIKRTFDAPRELVWKAWTEPERAEQWLGPRLFSTYDFSMDVRAGGDWHFRMRSADEEYGARGVVREAIEPERLVFTWTWDSEHTMAGRETLVVIEFAERGGRTEMTFRQHVFESVAERDGHNIGWSESFDKLAEFVSKS
jgi:uncharacterized protein YndB with AHSA1/START domain